MLRSYHHCRKEHKFLIRSWCYGRTYWYRLLGTFRYFRPWNANGGKLFIKTTILLAIISIGVTLMLVCFTCWICRCCRCCCFKSNIISTKCIDCTGCELPCCLRHMFSCCGILSCCPYAPPITRFNIGAPDKMSATHTSQL